MQNKFNFSNPIILLTIVGCIVLGVGLYYNESFFPWIVRLDNFSIYVWVSKDAEFSSTLLCNLVNDTKCDHNNYTETYNYKQFYCYCNSSHSCANYANYLVQIFNSKLPVITSPYGIFYHDRYQNYQNDMFLSAELYQNGTYITSVDTVTMYVDDKEEQMMYYYNIRQIFEPLVYSKNITLYSNTNSTNIIFRPHFNNQYRYYNNVATNNTLTGLWILFALLAVGQIANMIFTHIMNKKRQDESYALLN